jgi:hypothetical protein
MQKGLFGQSRASYARLHVRILQAGTIGITTQAAPELHQADSQRIQVRRHTSAITGADIEGAKRPRSSPLISTSPNFRNIDDSLTLGESPSPQFCELLHIFPFKPHRG